jgi:hypothetical protein
MPNQTDPAMHQAEVGPAWLNHRSFCHGHSISEQTFFNEDFPE